MNRTWCVLVVALLAVPASEFGSSKKTPDVDPRLHEVQTVFIMGNDEAAASARQNLSKLTCFSLADSAGQADATLDFSNRQRPDDSIIPPDSDKGALTAKLTAKDGSVLWNSSSARDAGYVNTGLGNGASHILRQLQAAAFPQVKIGSQGIGSACNQVTPPAQSVPPPSSARTAAAPAPPPTRNTKEIKSGMDTEQVERILGAPDTKVDLGEKVLYVYKRITVEFHNGKVTDAR